MNDYKPKEWQDLEELYKGQNIRIRELEEENRKLREELEKTNEVSAIDLERVNEILQLRSKIERLEFDVDAWHQLKLLLEWEIEKLKEEAVEDIREIALLEIENKKLKKDLAMYEKLREQLFGWLEPEDLYED